MLQIKTTTEGYEDRSAQTILLKTMYLKKFWRFQHKVQIGIREHFYQDFRAKLVSDPIFVPFHFSLYCYLIMQCRRKVRFIGRGGGGNDEFRRLELLMGSGGMLPQTILKYRGL